MSYARQVWSHLRKDMRLEWRSRDAINGMLFFSLLVVVVFSLAFDPTAEMSREIAGGIIVGCAALHVGHSTEPELDARVEEPCAGGAAHVARAGLGAVSG